MLTYSEIRRTLGIGENAVLRAFEDYCLEMSANTRVVEWSCKVTSEGLDGARFLHTALLPSYSAASGAVSRLCERTFGGRGTERAPAELRALLDWAELRGSGVAVGYAGARRPGASPQIKLYVTTRAIGAATPLILDLVPAGALPPLGTTKLMIAAAVGDPGSCECRAYYLWDQGALGAAECADWMARWCSPAELDLIARSGGRTVSIAFKEGRDDMLYLSAPFTDHEVRETVSRRLCGHPLAGRELGHLRWIGLAKRGDALRAEELNAYFNSAFDARA